jgi:DNA replication initiation complex subunit (GINS family)
MEMASNIQIMFNKENGASIQESTVKKVLREILQIRYNKVVKVSPHANTDLSRVLH